MRISRNVLTRFQTYCPLEVQVAQTVVHSAHFQVQASKPISTLQQNKEANFTNRNNLDGQFSLSNLEGALGKGKTNSTCSSTSATISLPQSGLMTTTGGKEAIKRKLRRKLLDLDGLHQAEWNSAQEPLPASGTAGPPLVLLTH